MDTKVVAIAIVAILVVGGVGAFLLLGDDSSEEDQFEVTEKNCLKIFGNADGNYLLNDKDKDLIKSVIDGEKTVADLLHATDVETNKTYCLADTNLDGKVDQADIDLLDKVIDRTAEKFSFIDTFGHLVSVPMNIERTACDYFATSELLHLVGGEKTIVAAPKALHTLKDHYLQGVPGEVFDYNSRGSPDWEGVAETDPQVWVLAEDWHAKYQPNTKAVVVGLNTLTFDFKDIRNSSPIQSALLAGYMYNNVDKALEYVDWYIDKWTYFNEKTKDLADSDRPRVLYTGYGGYFVDEADKNLRYFANTTVPWQAVKLAGGYNIYDEYPDPSKLPVPKNPTAGVNGDFEWVSDQKFDYLFAHCTRYQGNGLENTSVPDHGYTCDDNTEWVNGHKHVASLEVIKNCMGDKAENNVYLSAGDYMNSASGGILNTALVAAAIHPDLFPDLDMLELQQEYVDMMGFDIDLSKHGTFVYDRA